MDGLESFHQSVLSLNPNEEIDRICNFINQQLEDYNKEGIIVGLSGGIDSALAASLSSKAVGSDRVFGLILPEKDSNPMSEEYAMKEADRLNVRYDKIDITNVLSSFGTYEKRDSIIKTLIPDYNESYKIKLSLPSDLLDKDAYNVFKLTVEDRNGDIRSIRLNKNDLQGIVAATNTKQRTRMMHLYYYAEKMNYLVCGTTNRTEYIQGFFVKFGDGGVDIEPLMHLYKTQIFQLADTLGIIDEIMKRKPSPDTFSFAVSDEEFFFRIPFEQLDLLLYSWEHKIPISNVCDVMGLDESQVNRAFRDFESKYRKTKYQRDTIPCLL